jgi:hypothetical protein
VVDELVGDVEAIGALDDAGGGVVVDQEGDLGVEFIVGDGGGDRFKVAAAAGGHDGEAGGFVAGFDLDVGGDEAGSGHRRGGWDVRQY